MTILDDAIREHLELKRKHGARDSEVKQLEDEAFGPAERPGEAPSAEASPAADPYAEPPPDMRPDAEVATAPPVKTGAEDRAPEHPAVAADGNGEPAGGAIFDHQAAAAPTDVGRPPEPPPAAQTQIPTAEPPAPEAPAQAVPETAEQPPPIPPEEPTPTPEPPMPEPTAPPAAQVPMPSAEPAVEPEPTPAEPEREYVEPEPEPGYVEPEHEYFQPEADEGEEEISDEIPFADLDLSLDEDDQEEEIEPGSPEPESDEQVPDEDTGPFAALLENEAELGAGAEGHDVLEETPDFLKDVPEHEELWFEQRPPKDFDFGD